MILRIGVFGQQLGFERAGVAVELAGAVADEAVGIDVGARRREVAVLAA